MAARTNSRGRRPRRRVLATFVSALLLALLSVLVAPQASAHAELRQASPQPSSIVGGEFHSVSLQFTGLDTEAEFRADLLDPAGEPIGKTAVREKQRIVIPIEPLETPGTYTVSFTTTGVDGDLVSDLFTFRYDPSAAEPEGITIDISTPERLGWFGWTLLLIAAALAGYLAHRVSMAWRDHKAAAAAQPIDV